MKEYVIETKQVTKAYGSFLALDHVDVHIKKGHIYGLVGDNGAGKSTLLKLLAGHSFATEGKLGLFGKFGKKELEAARKNIGCMIERPGFFPNMTVEQTLKYYCIQKGMPDTKNISEILDLTGIAEKRKSRAKTLSLGQKQRLGLAIAMIGEPQILILDEPINGMDPSGILEFRKLFCRLKEEKNITILLSSHILSELQQIADDYGFLSRGMLIEEITAEALMEKCTDCIEIIVSDVEKYAAVFEQTFPKENYKILLDAVYLIAVASLISGIVLNEVIDKNVLGIVVWACIWFVIPKLLLYLGMRIETVFDIAMWLPTNFFTMTNGQNINTSQCITIWELSGGLFRCICSGGAGIVIFSLLGVFTLRKKEL